MSEQSTYGVVKQHPSIWWLANDTDGERFMGYDGAVIRCGREDCDGFSDGIECPKGCGVQIYSNQSERDEQYRREMDEQEAERRAWREQRRREREERSS